MTQDTFSVIFLEYCIKKYEHFFKVTFHGFAAHLKDYFSARIQLGYTRDGKDNIAAQKKKRRRMPKSRIFSDARAAIQI